jgi:hypothetical protein
VLLVNPSEVRAGSAAESPPPGKISGPAVSGTIVIDPTYGSPTIGKTAIRLTKGTLSSGALFRRLDAEEWVYGCDGTLANGAFQPLVGTNLVTLTNDRFLNKLVRTWIPSTAYQPNNTQPSFNPEGDVLTSLFEALQLAQTVNTTTFDPIITDIDNVACTASGTPDGQARFVVSFIATIQFLDHTK